MQLYTPPSLRKGIRDFEQCSASVINGAMVCERPVPRHRVSYDGNESIFLAARPQKAGLIYECPDFTLQLSDLPLDTFGVTYLRRRPFQIVLNRNMQPSRIQICAVHELLHVYTEMFKIPLDHAALHTLAVFMNNSILPSTRALMNALT